MVFPGWLLCGGCVRLQWFSTPMRSEAIQRCVQHSLDPAVAQHHPRVAIGSGRILFVMVIAFPKQCLTAQGKVCRMSWPGCFQSQFPARARVQMRGGELGPCTRHPLLSVHAPSTLSSLSMHQARSPRVCAESRLAPWYTMSFINEGRGVPQPRCWHTDREDGRTRRVGVDARLGHACGQGSEVRSRASPEILLLLRQAICMQAIKLCSATPS